MIPRTGSSRRRRASRSAATSPQTRSPRASAQPSRRASLATAETDEEMDPIPQRSPRASLAPEAAMDIPNYNRSPRHSLAPEQRSARNSMTPEAAMQMRNSLAPSRNNLNVELSYGSRLSLNPQDFNRSPRNSITPDMAARSPRRSLVPDAIGYQGRNSLVPDVGRSPRHSVASIQIDPARSQKDIGPSPRTSPRGSIAPEMMKSKDHPMPDRTPRGSLVPDSQRSPRGSIAPSERSARGSLVTGDLEAARASPRGSLTLTFQEPLVSRERRASEDSQAAGAKGRSVSPYRASLGGRQSGAGATSDTGSRRASSSVSQVSGDEQRRLCGEQSKYNDRGGLGLGVGLTTYGSVAYQLKDANMEASGTVDFVCRAAQIMNRTILMTVFLACLSTLPVIMLIVGVQYIRDCPAEPRIPVYMVVGGASGGAGICWLLWAQLASRSSRSSPSLLERVLAYSLTLFLLSWFALGNIVTLEIMWPDYAPTLFEPNKWCHRTLYVFTLTQLGVVWGVFALMLLLLLALVFCQIFGCGWLGPPRYK